MKLKLPSSRPPNLQSLDPQTLPSLFFEWHKVTDAEGVASELLELLTCLSVGTQRASQGTSWEALACLHNAYPLACSGRYAQHIL